MLKCDQEKKKAFSQYIIPANRTLEYRIERLLLFASCYSLTLSSFQCIPNEGLWGKSIPRFFCQTLWLRTIDFVNRDPSLSDGIEYCLACKRLRRGVLGNFNAKPDLIDCSHSPVTFVQKPHEYTETTTGSANFRPQSLFVVSLNVSQVYKNLYTLLLFFFCVTYEQLNPITFSHQSMYI